MVREGGRERRKEEGEEGRKEEGDGGKDGRRENVNVIRLADQK